MEGAVRVGDHYFKQHPNIASNPFEVVSFLRGKKRTFLSDHGVFSKKEVDFGSRLLIDAFTFPEIEGDLLDVGCGYGPIGLTLATETDRTVWLVDVNERAVQLTKENAKRWGLLNVQVALSDLFAAITEQRFAAIVSNPPIRAGKKVVYALFEEAYDYLLPGGSFWIVIQKKQGAASAKKKLMEVFGEVDTIQRKKGYYIFCANKS